MASSQRPASPSSIGIRRSSAPVSRADGRHPVLVDGERILVEVRRLKRKRHGRCSAAHSSLSVPSATLPSGPERVSRADASSAYPRFSSNPLVTLEPGVALHAARAQSARPKGTARCLELVTPSARSVVGRARDARQPLGRLMDELELLRRGGALRLDSHLASGLPASRPENAS